MPARTYGMKSSTIMPEVALQFVAERDIGSAVIEWFSAGHVSHAESIIDAAALDIMRRRLGVREGSPWTIVRSGKTLGWPQAGWFYGARSDRVGGMPPGVWPRPPNYAVFSRRVVMTIPATDEQVERYWQWAADQLGKPYDWLAIIAFLPGRNWRSEGRWYCSEEVTRDLEVATIFQRASMPPNKVTPNALALAVSVRPGVTVQEMTGC